MHIIETPAVAASFFTAGFDLVSVIPPGAPLSPNSTLTKLQLGKIPGRRGPGGLWAGYDWRTYAPTIDDARAWDAASANLGVRAVRFPAVDIDCTNPQLAGLIERIALDTLGPAPIRTGLAPKRLLMYRAADPFKRLGFAFQRDDEKHLVEILGEGNYYLVAGIHPKTLKPYRWDRDVTTLHPDALTPITRDRAAAFLDALDAAVQAQGYATVRQGSGQSTTRTLAADQESLRAPSVDVLREAVTAIPNTSAFFPHRDDYIRMGYAIRAAAGPGNEEEGFELYAEWAARWDEGRNDPETVWADWRRMSPPYTVGWPWVAERARPYGFCDAQLEFDADPTAEPPLTPALRLAHDPLPTEGERLAALTGDAERVFLLELADLPAAVDLTERQALLARPVALRAAARTLDPLAPVYRGTVLPAVPRCGVPADDPARFGVFLSAYLERQHATTWRTLDDVERALLVRAAHVQRTERVRLSQASRSVRPRPLAHRERPPGDDLIADALPRTGLAFLAGDPGAGKSAVAVELACNIAAGPRPDGRARTFAGRDVRPGAVVYCAAEDGEGIAARAAAWAERHGVGALPHLLVYAAAPDLASASDVVDFLSGALAGDLPPDAPPLRLIVVDTFNMAFSGDENSATDVGSAMRTTNRAARLFDAAVVIVHHPPKSGIGDSSASSLRGSGSLNGAADLVLGVKRESPSDPASPVVVTSMKTRGGAGARPVQARYRLTNGAVLEPVAEPAPAAPATLGERASRAVALRLWAITQTADDVRSGELRDDCASEHPTLFGALVQNSMTRRANFDRAVRAAKAWRWIAAAGGRGRYTRGSVDPSAAEVLDKAPPDLAPLLLA